MIKIQNVSILCFVSSPSCDYNLAIKLIWFDTFCFNIYLKYDKKEVLLFTLSCFQALL